jgi:hypothetical protein
MVLIMNNLESFLLPKALTPFALLPSNEKFAALKQPAFLSAMSKAVADNLFVLPRTICRASAKCHSTVSVFIVHGFMLSPFFDTVYLNCSDLAK